MKLVVLVAVLAVVTACKKEDKPAAKAMGSAGSAAASAGSAAATSGGGGGDCSKVVAAVDAMAGAGPMAGGASEVPAKLKAIMLKRCSEDAWPQSVIDCYANEAKDMDGMKKCRGGLPPELSQKLVNEIRTVMAGAGGGMAPPGHGGGGGSTGGSATAGSGAGSAK